MYPRSVPYEQSPPLRDNIITVAMPGITSSRSQIARYVGPEGVTVLQNGADGDPALAELEDGHDRFDGWSTWKRVKHVVVHTYRMLTRSPKAVQPALEKEANATVKKQAGESTLSARARLAEDGAIGSAVLYCATCRVHCRLLHNVLASPEVAEMVHVGWYRTVNPVHWLHTAKELATCFWFAVRPFQWCYSIVSRTNLAGLRDQATFTREVRRAVHTIEREYEEAKTAADAETGAGAVSAPKRKHLVLFGCSRGATTCFYAAMKLPAQLARYVSLVIVEAPFDTMEHVINASSLLPWLNRWMFNTFCDYRGEDDQKRAYDFDPMQVRIRCPVAFVMSTRDKRVPNACTQVLIDRVRSQLVPHAVPAVEVLVLHHSRHPCMAVGHREDQAAYVSFVERLYTTYCP